MPASSSGGRSCPWPAGAEARDRTASKLWTEFDKSLLAAVFAHLDLESKFNAGAVCRSWRHELLNGEAPGHWGTVTVDVATKSYDLTTDHVQGVVASGLALQSQRIMLEEVEAECSWFAQRAHAGALDSVIIDACIPRFDKQNIWRCFLCSLVPQLAGALMGISTSLQLILEDVFEPTVDALFENSIFVRELGSRLICLTIKAKHSNARLKVDDCRWLMELTALERLDLSPWLWTTGVRLPIAGLLSLEALCLDLVGPALGVGMTLTNELEALTALTSLSLKAAGNCLAAVGRAPCLRRCSLFECILAPPSRMGSLPGLTALHISGQVLGHAGRDLSWISKLSSLRSLSLENVAIEDGQAFGSFLGHLPSLEALNLSMMRSWQAPDLSIASFHALGQLSELSLMGIPLAECCMPTSLSKLHLDLHYTGLKHMPGGMSNLCSLTCLEITCQHSAEHGGRAFQLDSPLDFLASMPQLSRVSLAQQEQPWSTASIMHLMAARETLRRLNGCGVAMMF